MSQKQNRERRIVDSRLATKVGIFNAVGFILIIASPMIIDPVLTSIVDVRLKDRHYAYWKWALTLGSVLVFLLTRILLKERKVSRWNYVYAFFSLLLPAWIIAFTSFRPEVPHQGVLLISVAYASASLLTVAARQSRETFGYVNDPNIEFQSRLERLKASINAWLQISVYGMAAYIGFVAVALSTLWTVGEHIVTLDAERLFLLQTNIAHLAILSFVVGLGPLHECFEMIFESVRELSSIKQNP